MSVVFSDSWPVFNLCSIRNFRIDDLLFVVVELAPTRSRQVNDALTRNELTKITCRQVMTQQPDIPAAPHRTAKGQIALLISRSRYSDPAFHLMLDKFELSEISATPANTNQVERCWEYWINMHISAQWPTVAGMVVDRRNFLEPEDERLPLKCVRLTIHSVEHNLVIRAQIGEIRLLPVGPEDLNVDVGRMDRFMRDSQAVLSIDPSPKHSFCYLPKLNSGTLISVSRTIPSSSPFANYHELRQYWRAKHGYILPEDCSELVYFNVEFGKTGIVYSYPSCCVYSRPPEIIDVPVNPSSTLREFWQSLVQVLNPFRKQIDVLFEPLEKGIETGTKKCRSWGKKLSNDILQDERRKRFRTANCSMDGKTSPYFPPMPVINRNLINSRITEYFQHSKGASMDKLWALSSKIPVHGVKEGALPCGRAKKLQKKVNVEELARTRCLKEVRIGQLRTWLQEQDIPFHPRSNHQELCLLVYNQLNKKKKESKC